MPEEKDNAEQESKDSEVKEEKPKTEDISEAKGSEAEDNNTADDSVSDTDNVEGEISVEQDETEKKSAWREFVKKHQIIFLVGAIGLFLGIVALVAILFFRDGEEVDFSGGVKGNEWMGAVVSFSLNVMLQEDMEETLKNLEVEIFLELSSDDVIDEVVNKKTMLTDIFTGFITGKKAKEIDSLAEQKRLKKRIKELANAYIYSGKVKTVYFTRFRIVSNDYMMKSKKN